MKYEIYLLNEQCKKVYKGSINECINYMKRNSNIFNQGFVYQIFKVKDKKRGLVLYKIRSSDDLIKLEDHATMFERLS